MSINEANALAGAILGLGFRFLDTSYQVSINLRNNEGLGILSIKTLQATLPNPAPEILEKTRPLRPNQACVG